MRARAIKKRGREGVSDSHTSAFRQDKVLFAVDSDFELTPH